MISIEIANLEIMLGELLGALLHIDPHFGRVVYLSQQGANGRLAMIANVLNDTLVEGTEGHTHVLSLIERARKVVNKRHRYIHDAWGTAPDDAKKIVRRTMPFKESDPPKVVSLNELKDLVTDIRELTDDVMKTVKESYEAWPPYTSQPKSPE